MTATRRTLFMPREASGSHGPFDTPSNTPILQMIKIRGSPWQDFDKFLEKDEAGTSIIAMSKKSKKVVAIKCMPNQNVTALQGLQPVNHENIVQCQMAYLHVNDLFLVYEKMIVPLFAILETPRGDLELPEIATITMAVLRGLDFIHSTIKVPHGSIKHETILIGLNGQVKIANIVQSMVSRSTRTTLQGDINDVGIAVRDMVERDTALDHPGTIELHRSYHKDSELLSFLRAIPENNAKSLLMHPLFKSCRGHHHLVPYVHIAQEMLFNPVKVFGKSMG